MLLLVQIIIAALYNYSYAQLHSLLLNDDRGTALAEWHGRFLDKCRRRSVKGCSPL